jgi:hypothetical protein
MFCLNGYQSVICKLVRDLTSVAEEYPKTYEAANQLFNHIRKDSFDSLRLLAITGCIGSM